MVRIRFARRGAKKRPFYWIVVTEHDNPRDGRFIEKLGYYNPVSQDKEYQLDVDRIRHWMQYGAKLSNAVRGLLRKAEAQGGNA